VKKDEVATGMSEARSHQCRGKKTPTLVTPGREAVEHGDSALHDDPNARIGLAQNGGGVFHDDEATVTVTILERVGNPAGTRS
jgi:hypothetical protein